MFDLEQRSVLRRGARGRELDAMLELTGVELITPERYRLGGRPPTDSRCASNNHVAKTVGGLVQRPPHRLPALTRE
jgi:hypothetical protein